MPRLTRREILELAAKLAPAAALVPAALLDGCSGCGPDGTGTGGPGTGAGGTGGATATGPTAAPATASAPNPPLPENVREVLRAVQGRILPLDDEPGAIELGCFDYLESQLALPVFAVVQKQFIFGAVVLDRMARDRGGKRFHEMDGDVQDDILKEFALGVDMKRDLDTKDLFLKMVNFTMEGALGLPSYGGNRDGAGWKLIGFVHHG
jgi:gluconate 2-dehydrogenase gamma chain